MKFRKIIALTLCAALCACSVPPAGTETYAVTEAPASETTTGAAETEKAESAEQPDPREMILDSRMELDGMLSTFIPFNRIETAKVHGEPLEYTFLDDREIEITNWNACRESTGATSKDPLQPVTNSKLVEKIDSPYDITYKNPRLSFGKPYENRDVMYVKLTAAKFGCTVTGGDEPLYVNAFIRKQDDGTAEFIIDPAYLRGIPTYSKSYFTFLFDINGEKLYMDTFSVTADIDGGLSGMLTEDYVYAKLTLDSLDINYEVMWSDYDCTAKLTDIEIIYTDTMDAIEDTMIEDFTKNKDPEMTAVFNALVNDLDKIYTDDIYGIILLDMDFDYFPEVLVSHVVIPDTDENGEPLEDGWAKIEKTYLNVDVYRVVDEKLKYIDTIEKVPHIVINQISAYLGRKTLDDGTRCWYTQGKTVDRLFTLEGDKLTYREVFGGFSEKEGEKPYFIYFGEKKYPTVTEGPSPYPDDETTWTFYSYKDITAAFGFWELYAFIRERFVEDIDYSYSLYSDWIIPNDNLYYINFMEKNELSRRDIIFNLAYAVDAFFLGRYSPEKSSYTYEFRGAYAKPVIYLYPEQETDISVSVDFTNGGEITCSYPEYNGSWEVTALPDGTLFDKDGNEYYCLYWEGRSPAELDCSAGWCVAGRDTAGFLREKLLEIGLTAREANEFIIYWLPQMQDNPYNIITFHTGDYAAAVPLDVSPAPDSVIRVFMTFARSDEAVDIPPQSLPRYERSGFTLVEWGGADISE